MNQFNSLGMVSTIERVITELSAGKVQGCKSALPDGSNYCFYKGIPYAKPPVGELRFRPPVSLDRFEEDVLDCSYERNSCYTYLHFPPTVSVSEDCLYANVYTPIDPTEVGRKSPLPVMVWIHGGGFVAGSGDAAVYGPRYIVQEGVIVVTFNYRLGPLGFLYLPEKNIYGNMGLKDQRLLLKWVHENIAKFGGDPDNVTIFGESAGGSSCHLQYLCETSRKYFHKAICQSGVALTVWTEQLNAVTKAHNLAKLLGCDGENSDQVYETLMRASPDNLIARSEECVTDQDRAVFRIFAFTPVVEPLESDDPFITKMYLDLLSDPNMTNIPLILGLTSNEAICFIENLSMDLFANDVKMFAPPQLAVPENILSEIGEEVKRFYFGDRAVSNDNLPLLLDFVSDCMFVVPVCVASELHSRYQHSAEQYFYYFSFDGKSNFIKKMYQGNHQLDGAAHADELTYMFEGSFFTTEEMEIDSQEYKLRKAMCHMWTNFAKYGNPTPKDNQLGISWKPVEKIDPDQEMFNLRALDLNEQLNMVEHPFQKRIDFWKQLFTKYSGDYLQHIALK